MLPITSYVLVAITVVCAVICFSVAKKKVSVSDYGWSWAHFSVRLRCPFCFWQNHGFRKIETSAVVPVVSA